MHERVVTVRFVRHGPGHSKSDREQQRDRDRYRCVRRSDAGRLDVSCLGTIGTLVRAHGASMEMVVGENVLVWASPLCLPIIDTLRLAIRSGTVVTLRSESEPLLDAVAELLSCTWDEFIERRKGTT